MNKTGYFSHRDCRKHEMGEGHPECPQRLDAIDDRLLLTGVADALDPREAPQASIADLERAHGRMYVASLRGLTDSLREEVAAGGPAHAQIDPDTSLNVFTWDATLRAAGAAVAATDAVMAGARTLGLRVYDEEVLHTKDGRTGREVGIVDFDDNLVVIYKILEQA